MQQNAAGRIPYHEARLLEHGVMSNRSDGGISIRAGISLRAHILDAQSAQLMRHGCDQAFPRFDEAIVDWNFVEQQYVLRFFELVFHGAAHANAGEIDAELNLEALSEHRNE